MAASLVVDSAFLVALLRKRDARNGWAVAVVENQPPPWRTCEAALTEASYLLGGFGITKIGELLRRRSVAIAFYLEAQWEPVLGLMQKYREVPMSLADACIVRMTKLMADRSGRAYDGFRFPHLPSTWAAGYPMRVAGLAKDLAGQ